MASNVPGDMVGEEPATGPSKSTYFGSVCSGNICSNIGVTNGESTSHSVLEYLV